MFRWKLTSDTELRLLQPFHAEELFALVNSNRDHLRAWLPWVDDQISVDDSLRFIRMGLEHFAQNGSFNAGIWHQEALVGVIGLHTIDWNNRKTSIGYWLAKDSEGKGLMTTACRSLVEYVFRTLELNRIEIHCATGNYRSRAIPERLGFRHEGTLRQTERHADRYFDLEVYTMLSSDYETA